jgi:hypothetical protein
VEAGTRNRGSINSYLGAQLIPSHGGGGHHPFFTWTVWTRFFPYQSATPAALPSPRKINPLSFLD